VFSLTGLYSECRMKMPPDSRVINTQSEDDQPRLARFALTDVMKRFAKGVWKDSCCFVLERLWNVLPTRRAR